MIIKLWILIVAVSSMPSKYFKKINRTVSKSFGKVLKMENCPKIMIEEIVKRNPILGWNRD